MWKWKCQLTIKSIITPFFFVWTRMILIYIYIYIYISFPCILLTLCARPAKEIMNQFSTFSGCVHPLYNLAGKQTPVSKALL
jgi:hypothetical protein